MDVKTASDELLRLASEEQTYEEYMAAISAAGLERYANLVRTLTATGALRQSVTYEAGNVRHTIRAVK